MRTSACARAAVPIAALLGLCAVPPLHAQDAVSGEVPRPASAADEAFAGLDRATLRGFAHAAGSVRVRGRMHLAGRVFAEDFRVEPGAEVTIEAGTSVYSLGGIRIDAPLRGVPRSGAAPAQGAAKANFFLALGADGTDTPDITFICEQGDFVQS